MKGLDVKVLLQFRSFPFKQSFPFKNCESLEVESGTNDIKNYGAFEWEGDT